MGMAEEESELWIEPELRPGVWANWIRVLEGAEEFVVDFACRDPYEEGKATFVGRVRFPPSTARDFLDELELAWRRYAQAALPKEVTDADSEAEPEEKDDQDQGSAR